jgi:hypothetical protein
MSMNSETLFGGRMVNVLYEDGAQETVKVRQLRLSDYERAYTLTGDEFAFTAFCCLSTGTNANSAPHGKEWALTLQPESYELVQAAAREVNEKGFFSYASRRKRREEEAQRAMFDAMASLPPETLQLAAEIGVRRTADTSPTQSPTPRPR